VLKMIVEDGFFHADPHPGNVFYLPGNRIAFIDFGMVGRCRRAGARSCCNCCWAWSSATRRRWPTCCWTGPATHAASTSAQLEDEIEAFVDQYHGTPLAQLSLGEMLAEVTAILREHRWRCRPTWRC
jgi:ubiquinone biosynthesis protein